jgi:hypothetical protein
MAIQVQKITPEYAQRLLPERTQEEWAAMRQSFIDRGYVECSITGCTRLVSPAFIRRLEDDVLVAICPDRQGRHAGRLGPTRLHAVMRAYAQAAPVDQVWPEPTGEAPIDLASRRGEKEGATE